MFNVRVNTADHIYTYIHNSVLLTHGQKTQYLESVFINGKFLYLFTLHAYIKDKKSVEHHKLQIYLNPGICRTCIFFKRFINTFFNVYTVYEYDFIFGVHLSCLVRNQARFVAWKCVFSLWYRVVPLPVHFVQLGAVSFQFDSSRCSQSYNDTKKLTFSLSLFTSIIVKLFGPQINRIAVN